jgi:hypothetical protein
VFVEHFISVKCVVDENITVKWSFTKESGRLPAKYLRSVRSECWEDVRRAYLILELRDLENRSPYLVFSSFGQASLRVISALVEAKVARADAEGAELRRIMGSYDNDQIVDGLLKGGFSSVEGCECSAEQVAVDGKLGVCLTCRSQRVEDYMFVCQNYFWGVQPRGKGHWFTGWSDAIDSEERVGWNR